MSPDGPALGVMIGAEGAQIAALQRAHAPIPRPLQVRGLIDSAADLTAVAPRVLHQLGVIPAARVSTLTAAGSIHVNLFKVSLTISGPKGAAGPMLVRSTLLVSELATALPSIEALIGLDILTECLFGIDGPGEHFLLGF